MTDQEKCQSGEGTDRACTKDARGALKTTQGTKFTTVIYYDDREAPKVAQKLCKEHLVAYVVSLTTDIVEADA